MMLDVLQQVGLDPALLLTVVFVFLRVGAAAAILPVFGEQSVPQRIRLVFALMFTVLVAPMVERLYPDEVGPNAVAIRFALADVVVGLALGISLRLFIHALQIAGTIIAQSTSLAQLFGGAGVEPQPAIAHALVFGGLALAVTLGLHVKIVQLFLISYDVLPPGQFVPAAKLSEWGVDQIVRAFSLAFSLAAPFLLAALIYNIALGAINRAMPQLMVSFVGAPAITAGGLLLLLLVVPTLLSVWHGRLDLFFAHPFGAR